MSCQYSVINYLNFEDDNNQSEKSDSEPEQDEEEKSNVPENIDTGKSLSEALLFAKHGENMVCTKIVLNVRNNFCTQHVLPRFDLKTELVIQ